MKNIFRIIFCLIFSLFFSSIFMILFNPIFTSKEIFIDYGFISFDVCKKFAFIWDYIPYIYFITSFWAYTLIGNSLFSLLFKNFHKEVINNRVPAGLNLYIGKTVDNKDIYIEESGLYQNFLITGTIGSGKTSSAMYPFTKQLIKYNFMLNSSYNHTSPFTTIGMLILDVKGNFYKQVKYYCNLYSRENDLIIIELGGRIKYNPLHKPDLKPAVLANRLKTILTLFSPNNSESYWLDKAEQVLTEAIKFCRLYNNKYVTFSELHKLINSYDYFLEKLNYLKLSFQNGNLSKSDIFDLNTSLDFFQNEFLKLDSRVLSILKSEIARITGIFISDYDIKSTFCPDIDDINFYGFSDVLDNSKIVVLNMNIAKYRNLSKIIAAYLKLDYQSEILSRLSNSNCKPCAFICDEYHEYVTTTDADFFAQSREAKCINIVATQSYSSLLNTLKDNYSCKVIIQNLVNKLWLRTDDTFTIEDAQKQVGKEEKEKVSKSISENAKETNFDFLTNTLRSKDSNISESISSYTQLDYIYDTNFFTQKLETFSCLAFLSNGTQIYEPQKIYLQPYFKN